jgi:hypothetical protein
VFGVHAAHELDEIVGPVNRQDNEASPVLATKGWQEGEQAKTSGAKK